MSTANLTSLEQEFLQYYKQIESFNEAIKLIAWDLRTKIPKKGIKRRSETIGLLTQKTHELVTADEMKKYIDELKGSDNKIIQKSIELVEKRYNQSKKIPSDEYKAYVQLTSEAESVWAEAKEKNDFPSFMPYLEKIIDYNIRFADYWGYEENKYDALLDNYEPGVTVKTLDDVFPKLRKELSALIEEINQSTNKPNSEQILKYFPKENQEKFAL